MEKDRLAQQSLCENCVDCVPYCGVLRFEMTMSKNRQPKDADTGHTPVAETREQKEEETAPICSLLLGRWRVLLRSAVHADGLPLIFYL